MIIDLTDPNRPRFTLQELREVLQERNKLKVQLLVAQDELQCYKRYFFLLLKLSMPILLCTFKKRSIYFLLYLSGVNPPTEDQMIMLEDESIITTSPRSNKDNKEKSSVRSL